MSRELINRITIKKNEVYVSTHSSNDTAPFYSVKSNLLTKEYLNEGKLGLDKAIMKQLLYNWELKGNHKSVIPYQKALDDCYNLKTSISIREIRDLEDTIWEYDTNLKKDPNYKEIIGKSKEDLMLECKEKNNKLYTELAKRVEKYRDYLEVEQGFKQGNFEYKLLGNAIGENKTQIYKIGVYAKNIDILLNVLEFENMPTKEDILNKINTKTEEKQHMTFCAYATMSKPGEDVWNVKIVRTSSNEIAEKYIDKFKDIYKEAGDPKVEITWITSYPKVNDIVLQEKIESLYEKITDEGLYNTPNGNFIFDLNELNLNSKEEDLLLNMLKGDSRINDIEYNENSKEVDVIFYLNYCPNLDLSQDEIETLDEDDEEEME